MIERLVEKAFAQIRCTVCTLTFNVLPAWFEVIQVPKKEVTEVRGYKMVVINGIHQPELLVPKEMAHNTDELKLIVARLAQTPDVEIIEISSINSYHVARRAIVGKPVLPPADPFP